LLRSLQEIQPDFEEEAKAYAGLWSQGKKKKKEIDNLYKVKVKSLCCNWASGHEGVLGSGGIVPRFLDHGTRWK
jgi:hypothetical protein